MIKVTSRLVSGAVALAMAGTVPAWADTATQAAPASQDSASQQSPAGKAPAQAAKATSKLQPVHLAQADTTSGQQQGASPQLQEVVVTGIKQSMQSALQLKRLSDTIEDSIVASDIGELPDVTAIEALQRIPGIQISRQLGEGGGTITMGGSAEDSGYEIRGLPQAETTLNGEEVFSGQGSRELDLADIPSALLSGIDVYKDPTAEQLEGGIAGEVDLRTHRPFDFNGLELEGSAEEDYAGLIGKAKPAFTALASDTWETGIGKVGGLLTLDYQDRPYREDNATNNSIATSSTAVPGQTIDYVNGAYNTMFVGDRERTGLDAVLQWQPADDFQAYGEASGESFHWQQNQYTFFSQQSGGTIIPGSVTLFPGTDDAATMSFANPLISTVGAYRLDDDTNRQFVLHAAWTPGQWKIVGDLSRVTATEILENPAVDVGGVAPELTQITSISGVTQQIVSGFDSSDLGNYGGTDSNYDSYMYDTEQHFQGGETAGRLDVTYSLPSGFITSVQGGARIARRTDTFNQWTAFGAVTTGGIAATSGWFGEVPFSPFFSATETGAVEPQYVVFNPNVLKYNLAGIYDAYGITPATDGGSADYNIDERNYAGYLRLNFAQDLGPVPMSGNIGIRLVRHEDFESGTLSESGTYVPASFSYGKTYPLPSINLLFKLTPTLQARLAGSRTVSYPDFSQLDPSISLLPAQGAANGGNPYLRPTTANMFDASLEWYFAQGSALTGDVFYKRLQNFLLQETEQDAFTIDSIKYNLTGPIDGGSGTIKGFEASYQQFFTFLPSFLSGLGAELAYTYIDAQAPTAVVGTTTTLPGLSKNSYSAVGLYQQGPLSLRVAYDWRSQFYTTIYNGSNAQLAANPIYTKDYGWMDASAEYNVKSWLTLYAQGSNLLRTRIVEFYGVQTLPQSYTINDREAELGFRVKFSGG
jgi:iron complex outermembrane receptor protein